MLPLGLLQELEGSGKIARTASRHYSIKGYLRQCRGYKSIFKRRRMYLYRTRMEVLHAEK